MTLMYEKEIPSFAFCPGFHFKVRLLRLLVRTALCRLASVPFRRLLLKSYMRVFTDFANSLRAFRIIRISLFSSPAFARIFRVEPRVLACLHSVSAFVLAMF
jgi:hypothetical protein